jgi:Colicin V production protein
MIVDGIFLIISYAALHLGFKRGFVRALFGFFGWLLAFIFAIKLTPWGGKVIESIIKVDLQVNPLIAFVILALIGWRLVHAIGNSTDSKVNGDDISIFNGLAGSGLYWLAFVLTYSLVLSAADSYKMLPPQFTNGSRTYHQILTKYPEGAKKGLILLLPFIAEGWNVLDNAVSGIATALDDVNPNRTIVTPSTEPPSESQNSTPNAPPETSTTESGGPPDDQSLIPIMEEKERLRNFKHPE